jgi:phage terminase small subunit
VNPNPHQVAAFVNVYRVHLDARLGAIAAGYAPEWAYVRGSELLRHPAIVAALEKAKLEDFSLSTVRAADILRAASEIAYSDPIHAYDENGNLLDIRHMPAHTRRAIQSIKVRRSSMGTPDGKTDSVIEVRSGRSRTASSCSPSTRD